VPGVRGQCRVDRGQASGTQLIQESIGQGLHAITRYQPQSDKIMRMHAQTAMIENGFVHLPKEAGWLADYLHELTVFPRGKHDDQVDSTPQMLDWFKRGGQEPQDWLWQMYKEVQARGPQPSRPEPLSVITRRLGTPPAAVRTARAGHARSFSRLEYRCAMLGFYLLVGASRHGPRCANCRHPTSKLRSSHLRDRPLQRNSNSRVAFASGSPN